MGGEAIAEWLNHNGTVSLGYQWPGDLSIAERATKEPGNQNDGLTGPHRRSAEGLTIGDFYVSHHRAIDREREKGQAEQEHGGLDKALAKGSRGGLSSVHVCPVNLKGQGSRTRS